MFYECFCGLVLRRRKEKQGFFGGDRDFGLRDVVPVSASEELECLSVSFGGGCDAFFSRGTG